MSNILQEISTGLTYEEAESLLQDTLKKILPPDTAPAREAVGRLEQALGGESSALGRLPRLLAAYLAARGKAEAEELKPATFIFCADHGVAKQGVSAYPPETTYQMAQNYLLPKGGAANAFSDFAGSRLYVVDMGMNLPENPVLPGIISCHLGNGTDNFTAGPAMSRKQAILSLAYGIKMAQLAREKGRNVLLPGEMGISNTTAQACLAAVFCGLSPAEATGCGSRISAARLERKQQAVKTALIVNGFMKETAEKAAPMGATAIDILAKAGGFEFGAMAGLMLGGAALHLVTILDGANTAAAALVAQGLCPGVTAYLLPSHINGEKSHGHALKKLGLKPCLTLDINLSEACGSSILLRILGTALLTLKRAQEHLEAEASEAEAADEGYLEDEDYDGGRDEETGLPIDETALGAGGLHLSFMDKDAPEVTDKTFDFYLKTMPELDMETFEAAKARFDQLAKPRYSLGNLEALAAEFSGAVREPLPPYDPPSSVLLLSQGSLSNVQSFLSDTFASSFEADLTVGVLSEGLPLTAYFNFGREKAEEISFDLPLLVLTIGELEGQPLGTAAQVFEESLLQGGKLAYAADEFLPHVPPDYHRLIAAVMGALLAAAHNSSLIFIGDAATDIIARYTEKLCPELRPYVLHPEPRLMQLGIKAAGGLTGCLALHILEAALSALNNMKTFEETKVSLALDN